MHVLIIDDNSDNLEILAELLADENVSSTMLQNPNQLNDIIPVLETLSAVFLDLELADKTGYEILDLLKNKHGLKAPIVAYTVHISESVTARKMGFDCFVGKPLDGSRFPSQLRRILNGETVWEPR